MFGLTLTQHDEVDLAPVVLSSTLDFTVVLPSVGEQQVTDQQGRISAEVVPSKGQMVFLTVRCLIDVHLACKEGDDLDVEEKKEILEKGLAGRLADIC